jgi:glutamate/tyrosine decarboxylase-like PLP-dependent enzyme
VAELLRATEDGIVATGSPRYHGFVIGGALPAAVAADFLTTAWDQNAGLFVGGPAASVLEQVAAAWVLEALHLPSTASVAMVTGCQMAHVTCLAAARHKVLADRGWDVERDGLVGAPPIRVLTGELHHVTLPRAMRLLGLGQAALETVPLDDGHRMRADALAAALADDDRPTIVCAQLGEINTGAMDPLDAIADVTEAAGAWLHVDGAFGLWARASRTHAPLTAGAERADSWATDAHKWLNVPYDCGIAICADPVSHRRAMGVTASYLVQSDDERRDAVDWTPEFSRRARGTVVYAALRTLGRDGLEALVDRCCDAAAAYAKGLADVDGVEVLESGLDQVLLSFGDDDRTAAVIGAVQDSGVAWMSGTRWRDQAAMRISVVNWQSGPDDVDRTIAAITSAVAELD